MPYRNIAKVAVEGTNLSFDRLYSYLIPDFMIGKIKIGYRVFVPFGGSAKLRQGFIFEIDNNLFIDNESKYKYIYSLCDEYPLLTDKQILLAQWIAERTFSTLYESAKVMLPSGLCVSGKITYTITEQCSAEYISGLTDSEIKIINSFNKKGSYFSKENILKKNGIPATSNIVEQLEAKGYLKSNCESVSKLGGKTLRTATLNNESFDNINVTKKQQSVINTLSELGSASVAELCYYTGVTASVIFALEGKGILSLADEQYYRRPSSFYSDGIDADEIILTDEQQCAFESLKKDLYSDINSVTLLHGVTGSGKTSVYMKLIDEALHSDGGIIVMVPEISLTPQTLRKFYARYGDKVAVFHSGLSVGERIDEWSRVKKGEAKIAVGTRSAVFAPFDKVDLIIIDEEQEHTYKSERAPRYNTADIAKYICNRDRGLLLLASATPSVEAYTYALKGRYNLLSLSKRYGNALLPEVEVVDIASAADNGDIPISDSLQEAIKENLDKKEQSIILINRRGYNTYIVCSECKKVISCPNCSISLTYHRANNRLMCHYCGFSQEISEKCPECGGKAIKYSGFGTQRVEERLKEIFPDVRILRMDADTTIAKNSHEKKLNDFSSGCYDIMIGTQMVAKGLDFPNVTLVGVLSADLGIFKDDFKAGEKSFDLLTQVIGRAGRQKKKGKAIIQTLFPDNEIINFAASQDYKLFYDSENENRRLMIYPPYCDICCIGFSGDNEIETRSAAVFSLHKIKLLCSEKYTKQKIIVIGPTQSKIHKISNKYRYRLMIKCRNSREFRDLVRDLLCLLYKEKKYKKVTVFADINPENLF